MGCKTSVDSIYILISPQKSLNIYLVLSRLLPVELLIVWEVCHEVLSGISLTQKQGKVFFHSLCFLSNDYAYLVFLLTLRKHDLFVLHIHQGIVVLSISARKNKEMAYDTHKYKREKQ